MTHSVKDWAEAHKKLTEVAAGLPVYLGSGNPIDTPHALACTLDAWSGEGMGYSVWRYPQGDNGLQGMGMGRPHEYCVIRIGS